MTVRVRRHAAGRLGVAIGILLMLVSLAPAAPVSAASDRLPDLRMVPIRDLRIVKTSSGRRLLRFTTTMWNQGAGPFEVRASRPNTRTAWDVDQVIYDSAGNKRRVQTSAKLRFAGDGHDHWHVRKMASYHLWGDAGTLRDSKIGFCFFDTNLIDGDLPRSPSRPVYRESTCGGRNALKTRTGISVGWGDKYPWNFAYQWIDITGLPGGTYTLRSAVDLYGQFVEKSDTNNCSWARIRFNSKGKTVRLVDRGMGCVTDYAGTRYEDAIRWAREAGIATNCDADLYCPGNTITRGEVARSLSRALRLPATNTDFFDDDDGTKHETHINRLAAAGMAPNCGARRFCPGRAVDRGVGATFLYRAITPDPTEEDFFADDDSYKFEDQINALYAAGIVSGCGSGNYCPTRRLTRGLFTIYLQRAFGST